MHNVDAPSKVQFEPLGVLCSSFCFFAACFHFLVEYKLYALMDYRTEIIKVFGYLETCRAQDPKLIMINIMNLHEPLGASEESGLLWLK